MLAKIPSISLLLLPQRPSVSTLIIISCAQLNRLKFQNDQMNAESSTFSVVVFLDAVRCGIPNCFDSGMRLNDEINVSNLIFDRMHAHTKRVSNGCRAEKTEFRFQAGRDWARAGSYARRHVSEFIVPLHSAQMYVKRNMAHSLCLWLWRGLYIRMKIFCVVFWPKVGERAHTIQDDSMETTT